MKGEFSFNGFQRVKNGQHHCQPASRVRSVRVKREKAAEAFHDVKMRANLFADMKISLLNSAIERKALSFKGLCLLIVC